MRHLGPRGHALLRECAFSFFLLFAGLVEHRARHRVLAFEAAQHEIRKTLAGASGGSVQGTPTPGSALLRRLRSRAELVQDDAARLDDGIDDR